MTALFLAIVPEFLSLNLTPTLFFPCACSLFHFPSFGRPQLMYHTELQGRDFEPQTKKVGCSFSLPQMKFFFSFLFSTQVFLLRWLREKYSFSHPRVQPRIQYRNPPPQTDFPHPL